MGVYLMDKGCGRGDKGSGGRGGNVNSGGKGVTEKIRTGADVKQ